MADTSLVQEVVIEMKKTGIKCIFTINLNLRMVRTFRYQGEMPPRLSEQTARGRNKLFLCNDFLTLAFQTAEKHSNHDQLAIPETF